MTTDNPNVSLFLVLPTFDLAATELVADQAMADEIADDLERRSSGAVLVLAITVGVEPTTRKETQ